MKSPSLRNLFSAAVLAVSAHGALASASGLVISQVYGGGGNSGATYRYDFVEIFNAGKSPIDLAGYAVQYASSTGTAWGVTPLAGTLLPGRYYLVQEAIGAGGTTDLPTPDAIGTLALSSSTGKIALTSTSSPLTGAAPTSAALVDAVGYGAANFYEGAAPASALTNTLAALRASGGCSDTDSNGVDFTATTPQPRNRATPAVDCANAAPVPPVDPTPLAARIHDIQGRAHRSPLEGRQVASVPGIVTAVRSTGFYLEDPLPDDDPATSEGIFVYTVNAPGVAVGQYLLVSGKVGEFRPGGSDGTGNLTTTEIDNPTFVAAGAPPAALPPAVVIGVAGRLPPTARFASSTASGSVEAADYRFDAAANGIDFYESLEGMRVVVENAVATGPTDSNNETPIIGDNGSFATGRSARGGVIVSPGDFNPERILIDDALLAPGQMPRANVGDLLGPIAGIVDYSFGNFKLLVTRVPTRVAGPIAPEVTGLIGDASHLTLASFNVENLAPANGAAKFNALAAQIVANLRSPDVVALMEVQDNNGSGAGAVVDASVTLRMLTDAIRAAGGPAYAYRQIDPVADQDGGEPGGNIRQVFLVNPARVAFTDRQSAAPSTTPVTALPLSPGGVRLSASPGRIDPGNSAWASSRKPLVGEFVFAGRTFFVIANHFNSKGGDTPLFGRFQPPTLVSEAQRVRQATLVANFVTSLRTADPAAAVVVLGDLNDFEFANPLLALKAAGLADMIETLPAAERYTYVFEGNSQALDHILVSQNLKGSTDYDIVHVNAEFAAQVSDHDPEVARIRLGRSDYTAQFAATIGGLVLNRATGLFSGTLTLTNRSATAVPGPLLLSLAGLTPTVTLQNSAGSVQGMPSVALANGLAAGASASVTLVFANPNRVAVTYTWRVLEGPL